MDDREPYGRIVHEQRLAWNAELPHPRGVLPWEQRDEGQREMDMRIGAAVARQARIDSLLDLTEDAIERATAELVAQAVSAERERIRQMARRCNAVTTGDEGTQMWFADLIREPVKDGSDEKEAGHDHPSA